MSLRQSELTALSAELNRELAGGVIQDVHAPSATRVYCEIRIPGRSTVVLLCAEPQVARVSAVEKRPPNPPIPPAWQSVLRRELTGAKIVSVEVLPTHRCLLVHLSKGDDTRVLVFEVTGAPALMLLTAKGHILCGSLPFRAPLRVGLEWSAPAAAPESTSPSRLQSDFVHLRLAHGAESLFAEVEQTQWHNHKRTALEAKLKKIERTREKVKADASRLDGAQNFQREGTLLAQNLYRIERGQRSVTLTEYTAEGEAVECTITLDPKRSPKEEVEWRFHQYRRLTRGAQMAQTRLAVLAQEADAIRAQLAAVDAAPADAPAVPAPRAKKQPESLPYRQYEGHGCHRIWVGRGSKHNDSLTFRVAKPFHLWLHARGVPGAHVVVPLEKNEVVSSELLIDAAHLALHHSDLKGEPSGEVSSVPVKFVRKAGAPGAVTYTREKTIMVRVQPERLQRLLASEH